MSVFSSPIRNKPWVVQITLLSTALGGLLALSLKTQDQIRKDQLPTTRISGLAAAFTDLRETVAEQKKKIADLQSNLAKYQKAMADDSGKVQLLSADLQKANLLSGLVAVAGPGVIITLRDSKNAPASTPGLTPEEYRELSSMYIIHDRDIQMVLNELKAAGAEAIAINDQRVILTTAVRCVGPNVLVNNIQTGVPVTIKAIGDPDAILSGFTMKGGVQDTFPDASMFSIDKAKNLVLPAFAGPTPLRYAKPAPDAKAEQAQKRSEEAAAPGP